MKLDRDNPLPIAHQIEALIRDQIDRGELRVGERLPTEFELCERLGVSRTPVRRALGLLTEQGLIVRYPGRGTFVNATPPPGRRVKPATIAITVPEQRWCLPLQRAAARWNAEHPEQPVRLAFRIVGLARLRTELITGVAQGTAADIALLDSVWVAEFAERGYLHSLPAVDAAAVADLAADLFPTLRAENSYRGALYALPAEADFALLWYRRDWFAAEGLTPPGTWDDWLACAERFRRPAVRERHGLGPHPLAFAGGSAAGETATYQLLPVLWSAGADVIAHHEVTLDTPAAHRAVAFVSDLVRRHRVASPEVVGLPWNGPALAFAAGSVAMALGGSYESATIRAAAGWDEAAFGERVGFVPIPAGPDGAPATLIGGMSYAIFRQSRQPELALQVLVRATHPEVLGEFCAHTGQNPPTRSATAALAAADVPFLQATTRLFDHARVRWPLADYVRVSAQLRQMFESAIVGESAPAEAVARAAAVIGGITGLPQRETDRPRRLAAPRRMAGWG